MAKKVEGTKRKSFYATELERSEIEKAMRILKKETFRDFVMESAAIFIRNKERIEKAQKSAELAKQDKIGKCLYKGERYD